MTRSRWQRIRSVLLVILASYYFVPSLVDPGNAAASAKGVALLALAMAWLALDRTDERMGDANGTWRRVMRGEEK